MLNCWQSTNERVVWSTPGLPRQHVPVPRVQRRLWQIDQPVHVDRVSLPGRGRGLLSIDGGIWVHRRHIQAGPTGKSDECLDIPDLIRT